MDLLNRIWKIKLEQREKPYVSKYMNFIFKKKNSIEMIALLYVNIVTLGCTWKFSCMSKLQNNFSV